jgi:hypothetical protein
MKFTLNAGVHPEGDIVPLEKRGTILPSTKEATELRQKLMATCPRLAGKKLKKAKTEE